MLAFINYWGTPQHASCANVLWDKSASVELTSLLLMELVVVLKEGELIIYFIYIGEIRTSWLFLKFFLKLTFPNKIPLEMGVRSSRPSSGVVRTHDWLGLFQIYYEFI